MIHCATCTKQVPPERTTRLGYAAVTCSDGCYEEFRRVKRLNKRTIKGYRVKEAEFRYVLRIRRAMASGKDKVEIALQ